MDDRHAAFYSAWAELLDWMREYADSRGVPFTKEADFTDYIYRMERPYDLPTTVMVASLSDPVTGKPVLMVNASQRKAVFKEVVLHPFETHVYRKLTLSKDGKGLAEGKRVFTKEMLFKLADDLYRIDEPVAG